MSTSNGIKEAVVLSGGASQGAYHLGVLKALFEGKSPSNNYEVLDPEVITGTSAGSFNAAALLGELEAQNPNPIDFLEHLWLERIAKTGTSCGNGVYRIRTNPLSFIDPGCLLTSPFTPALNFIQDANFLARESFRRGNQFLESTESLGQRVLDQLNVSTFFAMDPFQEVLDKSIRFDLIPESSRYIRIAAVRWDTGFLRYFTNEDMSVDLGPKIVQASSAVPGFFPRVEVNGIEYGDGGVIENTPLQGAVEANADVIHVITSLPRVANIPTDITVNTLDTLYRMLVINVSKSIRRDIERYRNVNDFLAVLAKMQESGINGDAYSMLQQTLNRITRQQNPSYRQLTIHVYKPPEPTATALEFVNFDREYLKELSRKGYFDTISHNCQQNGCVIPNEGEIDSKSFSSADAYGNTDVVTTVDPGINF